LNYEIAKLIREKENYKRLLEKEAKKSKQLKHELSTSEERFART
jgi:hypothetical protein